MAVGWDNEGLWGKMIYEKKFCDIFPLAVSFKYTKYTQFLTIFSGGHVKLKKLRCGV
jgi:hypothetical protein